MITIAGSNFDPGSIMGNYPSAGIEHKVLVMMASSNSTYKYDSIEQLEFELKMRASIIAEAKYLNNSDFNFQTFRHSFCNKNLWTRTDEGGFQLNDRVRPSDAIGDIYKNSSKYGTECATAMVIVLLKATLDTIGADKFNNAFSNIYLMNWNNVHYSLGMSTYKKLEEYLPGDFRYFKNPDVNPLTPEWQGENTIDLSNRIYYGHGIGIESESKIIEALNENRISGSTVTAYLIDSAMRPDFSRLYKLL